MKDADIVFGRVFPNGTVDITDRYALDVGIPAIDEDIGGSTDIYDTWGSEEDGYTTIGWSRNATTFDQWDKNFTNLPVRIIFAYHPTEDNEIYHGPTRNPDVSINFLLNECGPGNYYDRTLQQCIPCTQGTYSLSAGAEKCLPCDPGSFNNRTGSIACQVCPPGTFQNEEGKLQCYPCPAGTSSMALAANECPPCPRGFFTNTTGATACRRCALDSYSPQEGSTACLLCPGGRQVLFDGGANLTDCTCPVGTFPELGSQSTLPDCLECPIGAICDGGGAHPVAKMGYWASAQNPISFLYCRSDIACPGGPPDSCNEGHNGPLCANCDPGYAIRNYVCEPCSTTELGFVVLILAFPITCFVCYILGYLSAGEKGRSAFQLSASLGLIIAYLQVMLIFGEFWVAWPPTLRAFFSGLDFLVVDLEFLSPECSVPMNYAQRYILKLSLPLIFIGTFVALYALFFVISKVVGLFTSDKVKRISPHSRKPKGILSAVGSFFRKLVFEGMDLDVIINALIIMADFSYIFLVQSTFELFQCDTQPVEGVSTLVAYPGLPCYSSPWYILLGVAVPSIIIYGLGIPAMFAYVLYKVPSKFANVSFR